MPKPKKTKLVPQNKILFSLGIIFLSFFYLYQLHLAVRLTFASPPPPQPASSKPFPSQISISSIKLNQPIFPTAISNDSWQVSPDGISFLSSSAKPGTPGPIILYGHNTNSRFGPIRWLKIGDQISLTTSDSNLHIYQVSQIMTVSPNQIEALSAPTETLILYTCTGFLDKDRFIIYALPSSDAL